MPPAVTQNRSSPIASAALPQGGVPEMADTTALPAGVTELLDRSNRLGSDPTVTNYGGGNTSVKVRQVSPATGSEVELLYVKGSGGDLGTLKAGGLAVLELDRVRALDGVYRGVEFEDEMVGFFPFCAFGTGGATPSIDTPMHGLVDYDHVDHLHPDAVIALACASDGEALVEKIWGGTIAWVPWKRPGWELGRALAALAEDPKVIGAVLGGHGLTAWGTTSDEVEQRNLQIIKQAQDFLDKNSVAEPFGAVVPGLEALSPAARRQRAAELFPLLRRIASADRRQVGHFTDSAVVLDFLSRIKAPALAELGTSCPDHFLRTKVRPLLLDTAVDAPIDLVAARLAELHEQYRVYY